MAAAAGALATVVVLVLVWLMVRGTDKPQEEPIAFPSGLPTATSTGNPLEELPSTAAEVQAKTKKAFEAFGKGLSSGLTSGTLSIPGLQGGSLYENLPRHRVTLRASSAEPIGTVGYVVPTSYRNSSGIVKKVGRSWQISVIAYGDPDYAQLFLQAGALGAPVTCTITVDGKVTERRSTEGPYGQLICQG